jgi:EmrB/QacA subfamily drug resistance transporter
MASMVMVAIEATIVSTAMPQIVAQLGGLRLYSWVFSSFLLAQTATTVVFGKLADLYGRKPVMLWGIAIFLTGSVLAGFAWSMPSMIFFRLIQGIGASAVQPVGLTIVADLYPARERGKVQGYLSSVWAVSAVLGPIVGGLILRNASWAWIFWINVPIGLAAAAGFILFLHDSPRHAQRRSIDIAGAALFTVAIAALLIALTAIGTSNEKTMLLMTGLFGVSSVLFVLQERRAVDPMISFALWSRRPIAVANAVAVFACMALMGLTTFLPMYVQSVLHRSAVIAGLTLTMMLVGWPAGSTLAARLFQRLGLRPIFVGGSLLIPTGGIVFILLNAGSSPVTAALGALVMGFGMGLLGVSSLILIQDIVDWEQRGSVTASNMFARNLGNTLGATVLGAVLNYGLTHARGVGPITSDQMRRLLAAPNHAAVGGDRAVGLVLEQSLHLTFWAIFGISILVVMLAILMPSARIGQVDEGRQNEGRVGTIEGASNVAGRVVRRWAWAKGSRSA